MPHSQLGRDSGGGVVRSVDFLQPVSASSSPIPLSTIFCRFLNTVKYEVVDGIDFVHLILAPGVYFEQYETV